MALKEILFYSKLFFLWYLVLTSRTWQRSHAFVVAPAAGEARIQEQAGVLIT